MMTTDANILLALEVKRAVNAIFSGKSYNNVRAMAVAAAAATKMQLPRYAVMDALCVSSATLDDLVIISEMYRDINSALFSSHVSLAVDAASEARRLRYGDKHHGIGKFYHKEKNQIYRQRC
ncbi:MAG: hypothetical protein ACI30K_05015 [Muribaculaceae bacterium]